MEDHYRHFHLFGIETQREWQLIAGYCTRISAISAIKGSISACSYYRLGILEACSHGYVLLLCYITPGPSIPSTVRRGGHGNEVQPMPSDASLSLLFFLFFCGCVRVPLFRAPYPPPPIHNFPVFFTYCFPLVLLLLTPPTNFAHLH